MVEPNNTNNEIIPPEAIVVNSSMAAHAVMVSPEIAAHWLETRNTSNRPVTRNHVERLKYEILQDKWSLNGSSICFDVNGTLIDGQHRLHAIMETMKTVPCLVITGIEDEEAFRSHGLSKPRSAADMAAIKGVKNYSTASSIARVLIIWDMSANSNEFAANILYNTFQQSASPDEVSSKALEVSEDVNYVLSLCREMSWLTRKSKWIAILMILFYIDKEKSVLFINDLVDGNQRYGENNYPVFKLRDKLITGAITKNDAKSNLDATAYIFKAWNLFVANKTCKRLTYSHLVENFPRPLGSKKLL